MNSRDHDEWTIERWRVEPRWGPLEEADDPQLAGPAPLLWKDVTVASVAAAILLWAVAAVLLG